MQMCRNKIGGHLYQDLFIYVYSKDHHGKRLRAYTILDDQSNKSLPRSSLFDTFGIDKSYSQCTFKTCAGVLEVIGRRVSNFIVESADGRLQLPLPMSIECDMFPDNQNEIPTPGAAHLKDIAAEIPAVNPQADMLLLLGRDLIQAHKVLNQWTGPPTAPFAQRLALG